MSFLVLALLACCGLRSQNQVKVPSQPQCIVTGDLEIVPFSSTVFHNERKLRVWLPPGYRNASQKHHRYPVLYLNDGQDLFDACTSVFNAQEWHVDEAATKLIRAGKIPPIIIVGIDNAGKHERPNEYLPYPDKWLQPPMPVVHGMEYPRFLFTEVMPFVESHYRVDPDPAMTGIGGSSYGAGIALYTVLERPGEFGRLLLESPSLYAHDNYLLHRAGKNTVWPAKIFVGVGTVNEPQEDVESLKQTLLQKGLNSHHFKLVVQPGAAHDENAWAHRFPQALEFLYGQAETSSGNRPH